MAERGLLAPLRRAVAPDHVGRTVAEKLLDIDLAGAVRGDLPSTSQRVR